MISAQERQLMQRFGARIAAVRRGRGWTQQEVAEATGLSVVAIAYIETGKRWARIGTLAKIARCLKVEIADLFRGL